MTWLWVIERERENEQVIAALLAKPNCSVASELAARLQVCRTNRLQRRHRRLTVVEALRGERNHRCKTVGCWQCRKSHVKRAKNRAIRHFAGADNAACALLTINAALPCADLTEVTKVHDKMRQDLANWRAKLIRCDQRFEHLAVFAMLEIQHDGSLWYPHWHVLVWHPAIKWREVAAHACLQWPGNRRVQVEPFWTTQTLEENINYLVGYAFKFNHEKWSDCAIASYYIWIRQRAALRSMCVMLNSRVTPLYNQILTLTASRYVRDRTP